MAAYTYTELDRPVLCKAVVQFSLVFLCVTKHDKTNVTLPWIISQFSSTVAIYSPVFCTFLYSYPYSMLTYGSVCYNYDDK